VNLPSLQRKKEEKNNIENGKKDNGDRKSGLISYLVSPKLGADVEIYRPFAP
jgi:hypothetical protein